MPGGDFARIRKEFAELKNSMDNRHELPINFIKTSIVSDIENRENLLIWRKHLLECITERRELIDKANICLGEIDNYKGDLQSNSRGGKLEYYEKLKHEIETIRSELRNEERELENRLAGKYCNGEEE